jgi:uncharacterized 2Fe-2S/4Fe-4S cluster protein (DUF4445 family)
MTVSIELIPLGIKIAVEEGTPLADVLADCGIEFPCGGADLCGGCRVRVVKGRLPARIEDKCTFTEEELAQGWRLACRARPNAPIAVEVGQWRASDFSGSNDRILKRNGLGFAIDLGTSTVVVQLLDLASGETIAVRAFQNPQCACGKDVAGRVQFALSNSSLTPLIRTAIGTALSEMAGKRCDELVEGILVGNAAMRYLFCGPNIESLSRTPFLPTTPGDQELVPSRLGWNLPDSCRVRFARCLEGGIGSNVLAGILAVGMADKKSLCALVDLGTQGEIVLGNRDCILYASAATGPAFEAGAIRMGMRATTGAIFRAFLRESELECHVVGGGLPQGICGSGLVDAVAAGLDSGAILPNGQLANSRDDFPISGPVALSGADIRELQQAKAAVAASLRLMLRRWGAKADDVEALYLAGPFGNYVRRESALRIGLLEVPPCCVLSAGNAALRGARRMLLSPELTFPTKIEPIMVASEPGFKEALMDCLSFPD